MIRTGLLMPDRRGSHEVGLDADDPRKRALRTGETEYGLELPSRLLPATDTSPQPARTRTAPTPETTRTTRRHR
ncbi:hypothetical protein ABIA38_008301 [Embleya sp. AB8]